MATPAPIDMSSRFFPLASSVVTFGPEELRRACAQLADMVLAAGFRPDLVVGIASGGVLIADELAAGVAGGVTRCDVAARRASSRIKKRSGIRAWLRRLPEPASNLLRLLENALGQLLDRDRDPPMIHYLEDARAQIRGARCILVADDAVDSGVTLAAVMRDLQAIAPQAVIRAASLVVTRPNARYQPDFILLRYRLIRFPWSSDYSACGPAAQ